MKKISSAIFSAAFLLAFIVMPFVVSAQNEGYAPAHVKIGSGVINKMEFNKQSLLPVYTGIDRAFILELDGCGSSEKTAATIQRLKGRIDVRKFEFIKSGKIKIYLPADLEYSNLKEACKFINIEIYQMLEESLVLSTK